jgi:uncharacterized protein YbjT (DUF2867 family)
MNNRTAVVIGATGLIGSHLLELLLNDSFFTNVTAITRRTISKSHTELKIKVIDFSDRSQIGESIKGSYAVFCAVGTTTKKVKGDKNAYRKVDHDIPVTAAELCSEYRVPQFLMVSSVGAAFNSKSYYLKLKGEAEESIRKIKLPSVSIFRPSMLLGKRNEFRFGERMAQLFIKPFSFMIPSDYKPVNAEDVAKAMIAASKLNKPGFTIYQYKEIIELVR